MIDFVCGAFGVSIRKACRTIPTCRATYHYRSRRPERAETHVRYGYRRITVLLQREGWHVNVKRVHRLYSLDCLQMRLTPPRRRVPSSATTAAMRRDPTGSGRWIGCMMSYSMADGCGFSRRHLEPRVSGVVRGQPKRRKALLD